MDILIVLNNIGFKDFMTLFPHKYLIIKKILNVAGKQLITNKDELSLESQKLVKNILTVNPFLCDYIIEKTTFNTPLNNIEKKLIPTKTENIDVKEPPKVSVKVRTPIIKPKNKLSPITPESLNHQLSPITPETFKNKNEPAPNMVSITTFNNHLTKQFELIESINNDIANNNKNNAIKSITEYYQIINRRKNQLKNTNSPLFTLYFELFENIKQIKNYINNTLT